MVIPYGPRAGAVSKSSPRDEIIVHPIEGQVVHQRTRDAYIDATALFKAAPGQRRVRDYQKRKKTKRFLKVLSRETGIPIYPKARNRAFGLIQSDRGGNNPFLRGIWFHPRVAIHAAQWLSPEFQVWVTGIVDEWREMQKLLRREPADWIKQFPDEFYEGIARLHGWPWHGRSVNPPQIVGHYTNDLVWDRLAPGLRQAIELRIPRLPNGEHKERMHQMLVVEVGLAKLQAHIAILLHLMDRQSEWGMFMFAVNHALPKSGRHLPPPPKGPSPDQGSLDL